MTITENSINEIETAQSPFSQKQRVEDRFCLLFILALSLFPVLATAVPRFLGVGPVILGIIATLAFPVFFKKRPQLILPCFAFAFGLLALGFLSSFWSVNPDFTIERVQKIALILIPGMALICVAWSLPEAGIRKYLWIFYASVLIAAIVMALEYHTQHQVYKLLRGIEANIPVPLHVLNRSFLSVILFSFCAFFIARHFQYAKVFIAALFLMLIPSYFVTWSQSSQLAVLVALLFYFLSPARYKIFWVGLFIGMVGVSLAALWAIPYLYETIIMPARFEGMVHQASMPHRMEIWDFTIRKILESPVYGHGLGTTRFITFDSAQIFVKLEKVLHPHNMILQLWLEFGLIGFAFFALTLGWILKNLSNLESAHRRFALALFMATFIVACIGYGLWQSWQLGLFILLSVLVILTGKLEEKSYKTSSISATSG